MAGDYVLLRKLGTGGFGTVFEARDRNTDLIYAVKRIELSEEDAERFRKEALYPARIASQSLHVLSVHSFFQDQKEGLFYLVTELIPHGDLRRFLDDQPKPLPLRQGIEIGLGIAKGLAAIHEQNIVHGDLKPANVLMDRKDGQWIPKIADFGLARSRASMQVSDFASPGYAAPEQMDLVSERLPGPESDLFAFGMVLYELLTGHRRAPTTSLREYGQWLARCDSGPEAETIDRRAVRPSTSSGQDPDRALGALGEARPELAQRPELDLLVKQLLAFDRRTRLASAADVVNTLTEAVRRIEREDALAARAAVGQQPRADVETRPTRRQHTPQEPRALHAQRKGPTARLWIGVAVVLTLGLTALAVVWSGGGGQLNEPRSVAQPVAPAPTASDVALPNVIGSSGTPVPSVPQLRQTAPEPSRVSGSSPTRPASSGATSAPAAKATTQDCARLNERFQIGETLTESERAVLKQCG
jgi:serine/threonine protein kinase